MRKALLAGIAILVVLPGKVWAGEPDSESKHDPSHIEDATQKDVIVVKSARQRALASGMLANTVQQTEVVDLEDITNAQASVLSEALAQTPGVRVANECSICGVKRLLLNGLGGQHTTILIDGLPAYTLVAGFYGPDALSVSGIGRIEVARGAGASLTAPEAIGGTVNIISAEPDHSDLHYDGAIGQNGYVLADINGAYVNDAGSVRAFASFQYNKADQFDADKNGVSENPFLQNYNYLVRLSFDPTPKSTISIRAAHVDSEIFGGPVIGDLVQSIDAAIDGYDGVTSTQLFAGDNVNNRYVGKPWETTEWIATQRQELMGKYFQEITDNLNLDAGISWSRHEQNSFYEGFDYRADNDMVFGTARVNWAVHSDHLLTFGVESRSETLRSHSQVADNNPDFISDSYDYDTYALFVQDSWAPTARLDVNIAVRVDHVRADFIDPQRPGLEIDQTLVSPRMDVRYHHTDRITSRLSGGRGYRAPLSFFETDHGILDAGLGFVVDVDRLERSVSANYALSFEGDRLTWTVGAAWTRISNLAALDVTPAGIPLLTQRDQDGTIYGATLDVGYQASDVLELDLTAESFHQDEVTRSIFGVAPVQNRLTVAATWTPGKWNTRLSYTLNGATDLNEYGYDAFDDVQATIAKPRNAPAFGTLDGRAEYALTDHVSVYAGGRNLLNATQIRDFTSPLFFDAAGGYDVAYIYGNLRGREAYVGIRGEF